jgi:hypothetical protein
MWSRWSADTAKLYLLIVISTALVLSCPTGTVVVSNQAIFSVR